MFLQKDRLHSADATTFPVDSFRRDLWMSLYEAYFVWIPTMYFHCAGCARLCPGLRSLGSGWLWDGCNPRLLGSREPSTFRSSRVFPAIFGRVSLCPTGESRLWFGRCSRKATVLRCIVIRTHLAMKFVVSTSMFCRLCFAGLCSLLRCMHWSWSTKIWNNLKIQRRHRCVWITIDDGVTVHLNSKRLEEINNLSPPPFIHQGPTNAMHVFVQRATCALNTWIGKL